MSNYKNEVLIIEGPHRGQKTPSLNPECFEVREWKDSELQEATTVIYVVHRIRFELQGRPVDVMVATTKGFPGDLTAAFLETVFLGADDVK